LPIRLPDGSPVQCPRCSHQFSLSCFQEPREFRYQAEPPSSWEQVFIEASACDSVESTNPKAFDLGDVARRIRVQPRFDPHYAVNVGEWLNVASHNTASYVDASIGFMLLWGFIQFVANLCGLFGLVVLLVIGPTCLVGPTVAAMRMLRSERIRFETFFEGFRHLPNLLLLQLVLGLLFVPVVLPFALLFSAADGGLGAWLLVGLPLGYVIAYLGVRVCFFTPLIVVDRQAGPLEAMVLNWELTRDHFWGLFGAGVVLGLVAVSGVVLCVVGLFYTIPLAWMAQAAGYLLATRQIARSPGATP
jgi:hypothetical protein